MKKILALLLIALPITTFGSIGSDITVDADNDFIINLVEISKKKENVSISCEYAKSFVLTNIDKENIDLVAIKFNVENKSTSAIIPYFYDFGITVEDNLTRVLSSNLFTAINAGSTGSFTLYYQMDKVPSKIDVKAGTATFHLEVSK